MSSKCVQHEAVQFLEEGRLVTNNSGVANIFKRYFTDGVAAQIPILHEDAFVNHLSINEIKQRFKDGEFSFHHVEEGNIKRPRASLNPHKATGRDKISPRVKGFLRGTG